MVPPVPAGCAPVPHVPVTEVVSAWSRSLHSPSGCMPAAMQAAAASGELASVTGMPLSSPKDTSKVPESKLGEGPDPPDDFDSQATAATTEVTRTTTPRADKRRFFTTMV